MSDKVPQNYQQFVTAQVTQLHCIIRSKLFFFG